MERSDAAMMEPLERLVQQVRGVMAARIVTDSVGQIGAIHVVASPERSAKQMVRDVESIIYVRGGVRVDHRKISLVQIAEAAINPPTLRARLLRIARRDEDGDVSVVATLAVGERTLEGVAHGQAEDAPERLAASATLRALASLVPAHLQLHLAHVQVQPFDDMHVCLAHALLVADDTSTSLLGVATLRDDLLDAAARATLDAVNRTLQRLVA